MTEQGENSELVRRVYAALKPGGWFVVEVPQRETAVSQLKPSDQFGDGERVTAVSRHYDPATRLVTENFRITAPETEHAYRLGYRLYDRAELLALLIDVGFSIRAAYGNYQGALLADEHPIMLVVGQKEEVG